MAYEYEHTLRNYLIGHRNVRPNFDGFEILRSLDELQEVYRKARAWDNYMVDTYIYDKIYNDGDHKEAYDFYMKPDVKSYIDCLNKELANTGHFINSVEEYKQILNEIEDKQND